MILYYENVHYSFCDYIHHSYIRWRAVLRNDIILKITSMPTDKYLLSYQIHFSYGKHNSDYRIIKLLIVSKMYSYYMELHLYLPMIVSSRLILGTTLWFSFEHQDENITNFRDFRHPLSIILLRYADDVFMRMPKISELSANAVQSRLISREKITDLNLNSCFVLWSFFGAASQDVFLLTKRSCVVTWLCETDSPADVLYVDLPHMFFHGTCVFIIISGVSFSRQTQYTVHVRYVVHQNNRVCAKSMNVCECVIFQYL